MRIGVLLTALSVLVSLTTARSLADVPSMYPWMMGQPMTIAVQATGDVDYTPDIAHLTLGVNGEAASAAAATANIAQRANAVIAALKELGIPAAGIKTSGYNLYYREATETVRAAFVGSETISIRTSVDKAGAAIDAGIRAGANQSYGLNYDTSQRDSLYKEAVRRAIVQARDLAQIAASAAGVRLGNVLTINVPGSSPPPMFAQAPMMRMAAPMAPPVAPGTGTMSASVTATFSIAGPGVPVPMPLRPLHS